MEPKMITTSFLISNLHCPSCIAHILDTLALLHPAPVSVSPSLVSSWVTVQHEPILSVSDIRNALANAGFDIVDIDMAPASLSDTAEPGTSNPPQLDLDGYVDRVLDRLRVDNSSGARAGHSRQPSRHIANCEACQKESSEKKNVAESSSAAQATAKDLSAMKGFNDERGTLPLVAVDSTETQDPQDTWRATLAVGGMTCAVCVGAITDELKKKPWVKNVVVNLISNSATVDFVDEKHKEDIVETIEDIGYDATIDTLVNFAALHAAKTKTIHRTVEILVDGIFCEHCPGRISTALEAFGEKLNIDKPTTAQDPILKVTYTPRVPGFTIRNIIAALSAVDPGFKPSIYHPPTLEERSRKIHAREQLRILLRVILSLVVAIPTLIIGIIYMSLVSKNNTGQQFLMRPIAAGVSRAQWALFIMATPVFFFCADVFHKRALKELRAMWRPGSPSPVFRRFYRFGSMNMLMSLGTSIAYISSVAQLIAAGVHPPDMVENSTFYFDSVVFLTLFLLIGRLIESYSKSKTGDAVTMLGKLRPTEALLVESDASREGTLADGDFAVETRSEIMKSVNVDVLELGDVVKVLHGASPPCDGNIVQGESKFDESSLTGESRLVKKTLGDQVFSGTVNKDSPVSVEITGVAGSSMLDQIVQAVREGQTRRAPMEHIADSLTSVFVPIITLIAIVTWLIWLGLGQGGVLPDSYRENSSGGWVVWSLQFAIAVFVVACPCGLALAAPTALFVGGGLAAQHGILVKGGGEAFEKASKLDCIVFDKTGTLTVGGEPIVTDHEIVPAMGEDEMESEKAILGMINAVESNSTHTVAKAIVSFCRGRPMTNAVLGNIEEIAGKGMKGAFEAAGTDAQTEIIIGNEALLSDYSTVINESASNILNKWKFEGRSIALVGIKFGEKTWNLAAIFAISDPIRPEAPGIINALHKRGTDVWMLSGDNQITANAIGAQVGIPSSNIIGGVLPSQKAEKIQYLQRSLKARGSSVKRACVAMVGDGINDSPALTTADVGIAIGSGSDIAISSAEFVLVSSNLNSLITLLDLSCFVFRRIKFNFGWALIYNLVALPVAAGVLYPVVSKGNHVRLDPVWASLAMAMSSISVVLSSLSLRSKIPGIGFNAPRDVVVSEA